MCEGVVKPFAKSQHILRVSFVFIFSFPAMCKDCFIVFLSLQMMEGVREITRNGAKFVDGKEKEFDSIIFATGYKSNVPSWLKVSITHLWMPFSFLTIYFLSYYHSCITFNLFVIHAQGYKTLLFSPYKKRKISWTCLDYSPPFQKSNKFSPFLY